MSESPTLAAPAPRTFGPLAGFGPVFGWGLRLTMQGKRFFLVAAVAAGIGWLMGRAATEGTGELQKILDEQVLKFVLPLVALTLVSQSYAREVQERTLVYHLVRPVSRATVFLARYLSGLVPACIVAVLLFGSLLVGAERPLGELVPMLPGILLGIAAVGAIYFVLSALLRHGMVAGLVYTFVFEALISSTLGSVQKLSVMFHVRSLHHRLTDPTWGELPVEAPASPRAAILRAAERINYDETQEAVLWLVGITVAFLLFGVWRTRQRDFALKD
jgi:ABC-type transport system involved in multi-copper enzyme maturation permease subunit